MYYFTVALVQVRVIGVKFLTSLREADISPAFLSDTDPCFTKVSGSGFGTSGPQQQILGTRSPSMTLDSGPEKLNFYQTTV
jgi:hypothetical protein